MKKKSVNLGWLLAFWLLTVWVPAGAQNLIPVRSEVAGYPDWTDVSVSGTGYLQLLVAGASTTTPAMNFSGYSSVKLEFKSRTYGGTNAEENTCTISVSTDNGVSWNVVTTRIPAGASLASEAAVDLTTYSATQVKIRFSVAGSNSAIGVGIDDITITGQGAQGYTLTLKNDGTNYTLEDYPKQLAAGSQVVLPSLPDCGEWQFAGWDPDSAVSISPAYAGGANYTSTAANVVLYAIYKQYDRSGESWTEVTGLHAIETGTYVVTNGDYYLPGTQVTNGPALKSLASAGVGVASGKLSGAVSPEMRWVLTGTTPVMTLESDQANASYLFTKDLSDGLNVGTTQVSWTFEEYLTGFAMKDGVYSRYCAVNPDASEWRSYSTRNSSYYKINSGVLELYRLSGSAQLQYSSRPGCTSEPVSEPTVHVSNLSATPASPAFSSVTLQWNDAPGASGFLVKAGTAGITDPIDGIAESNGAMVKNVVAGVQTVTFTGLSASTDYTFSIYPYNGSGTSLNYKTDGTVPMVQISTSALQWIETFDTGSKLSYTASDVSLATGSWNFTEAVLGSTAEDKKNGLKSARLRANGVISMNFDVTNGAGVIKVYHANYGLLSGGMWKMQLSYNSGVDWEDVGSVNACGSVLNAAYFRINRTEALRCRLMQTGGDRINIDDITISEYMAPPANTNWIGNLSGEWLEAANWSNGIPGSISAVRIESKKYSPEIRIPVTLASLVLDPAARLSILNGGSLTVSGDLILKSSSTGTATLVNHGTIQVSGKTTVEQYLETSGSSTGWWYLSSPVQGATSGSVLNASAGNKLGYYDETTATYPQLTQSNVLLVPGRGYLAYLAASGVYNFEGPLNDGPIGPISLTRTSAVGSKRGFNLTGNPYPSFIDWNALSGYGTDKIRTDIRPTIWLRTRTAGGKMVFDTFDGEVGTSLGIRGKVNQYIAPLQAFWVKVSTDESSPSLTFTNEIRSHQDQDLVSNRLRTPANQTIVRLELLSSQEERDEVLISTNSAASDGYDFYDSDKMPVEQAEIFSIVEQQELVINKLQQVSTGTKVKLGIRTKQAGTFSINASEIIIPDSLQLVITDRTSGIEKELQEGESYSFTSESDPDLQRFVLGFRIRETLSSVTESTGSQPKFYRDYNRMIVVEWDEITAGELIQLYGIDGRLLHQQPASGTTTRISLKTDPGLYILRIPSKTQVYKINQ